MFQITLSGFPVESNVIYGSARQAEHVAALRYSDPPVKADKVSHIKPRSWQEKGYRIEPAKPFPPLSEEDWRMSAIRNPGHVCRAAWGALAHTDRKPIERPTYAQLCAAASRTRVEDAQHSWLWLDAVDLGYDDRHDPEDNQEEPMAYGSYEAAA